MYERKPMTTATAPNLELGYVEATPCPPPSVGDAILRCNEVICDCHRQASLILQALEGSEADDPVCEPATIAASSIHAVESATIVLHMLERIRGILCG